MKRNAIIGGIVAALLAFSGPAYAEEAPSGAQRTAPWNAETSDLEPDTSIVYGRLPNGLRYAIRPNQRPQNQVVVRMALDFGSAAEADDEQGLAHFIEHMAFNGTTNVPEGEMVKMLERLGLSFGADTNASTGYTQTQYKLDLPKADPALDRTGVVPDAGNRKRSAVQSASCEPRTRRCDRRKTRGSENFSFQSSPRREQPVLSRTPIYCHALSHRPARHSAGKRAGRAAARRLYRKYYRPDRTKIMWSSVQSDVAAIERQIIAKFSELAK